MTQEQKAKAYDEAIERAKKHCADYIVETIFPELKESEDEKVEKAIFGMVYDSDNELWSSYDVSKSDVLAWLEKQGEQKPAWSEEDDKILTSIWRSTDLEYLETQGISKENAYKWIFSIKNRVQSQPKQEWSEEDEQMLTEIVKDLQVYKSREISRDAKDAYQNEIDWLKSLRPQNRWKPSDEQMEVLKILVDTSKGFDHSKILESLYNDLKKLNEK